jgi:hypothetical protein
VPQVEEVIELEIPVPEKKKRARKVKAATTTGDASKPATKPKGARKLATKLVIVEDIDTSASSNGSAPATATQKKKLVLQEGSDSD